MKNKLLKDWIDFCEGNKEFGAIHADHRNAPRMMTDNNKQTVWEARYSPFGEISIEIQAVVLQLRLPGQYEDRETGTYYNY